MKNTDEVYVNRLPYIDVARGIAIIFIVFGHSIVYSEHCDKIYSLLYSFHVSLFFIISGYVFKPKEEYYKFIENKFFRIMVPYFVWSFIFLIPYILYGNSLGLKSSAKSSFDVITQIKNILYGNGNDFALKQNSSLWFLPALFSMEVFFNFIILKIEKIKKKYAHLIIVVAQLLVGWSCTHLLKTIFFPWGINTVIEFGCFFLIGYYLKRFEIIKKIRYKFIFVFMSLIIGMVFCFANYKRVSAIDYSYGYYFFALISGFCLSMVVLVLCYIRTSNKVLEYIGKNTMSVLVFHKIIVMICQSKLGAISSILKDSNIFLEILIAISITSVAIFFSLVLNIIVNKKLPVLLGARGR